MATMTQPVIDAPSPLVAAPSPAASDELHEPNSLERLRPDLARLTKPVQIAIGVVAPLVGFLAVLGGIGSFTAVRNLAAPWFGQSAWIVPVGIDVGILALLSWDLIAEYLRLPLPMLRWTAWAFIGATVYLNVAAAHGDLTAAVMHAAMPTLFVAVTEGIRHLVRQLTGLATGTRIERIPLSRWLFAPLPTLLLKRRMVLWQVTSYRLALALEHRRLQAVARLQASYGQFLWRLRAPLADRLALRLASSGLSVESVEMPSLIEDAKDDDRVSAPAPSEVEPAAAALAHFLPRSCFIEPPKVPGPMNEADRILIQAATEIFRESDGPVSQATLAKKLRDGGHRVANERLRWLINAVQRASVPHEAP